MENPRPEKVAVVDEVRERLDSTSAALLTEYRGLDVTAISDLRRALRLAGGEYKIYKNTLVRFAARDLGLELEELLTGPTAIAFITEKPDGAKALADVEPREVLLAKLAGALAAPMVQLAGLLEALPRNFAYGLQALIDQQGGVPEEEAPTAEPADAPDATDATEEAPSEEPAAEAEPTTDDAPVAEEAPTEEPAAADETPTEE